jgi:hypothetical protein
MREPGTVSTACAFDQFDVTQRFVQTLALVCVEVPSENTLPTELVDGCRGDAELPGNLLAGEHTTLAQSVKPAL